MLYSMNILFGIHNEFVFYGNKFLISANTIMKSIISRNITIIVVRFSYWFDRKISPIVSVRLFANRINKLSLAENFSKSLLPSCTMAGKCEPPQYFLLRLRHSLRPGWRSNQCDLLFHPETKDQRFSRWTMQKRITWPST